MRVENDVWVTLRYRLYDAQGEELEPSERELTYLQGGYGEVFEAIEDALVGQEVGFSTSLYLEPEHTFGDYDPDLVRLLPRTALPDALEVGMTFEGPFAEDDGDEAGDDDDDDEADDVDDDDGERLYIVTEFTDEVAVLDGNHPLAGMGLRFDIEVIDLRPASVEEIEQERAGRAPRRLH